MRIVLLGPQGSGKGTQGKRLAMMSGAPHLATGDLVRAEITAGTDLGREIRGYNNRGELVPDDVILNLVRPRLTGTGGWILDGFPRDQTQARALDRMLESVGLGIDRVVILQAADDDLIARLLGRVQSQATGKTYHLTFDPPPPSDPGPFVRRADDTPEDVRRRLDIYHQETEPLVQRYSERGILSEVDATGSMDSVTDAIIRALDQHQPRLQSEGARDPRPSP